VVGERAIHVVEELLGVDEAAAVALAQGAQHDAGGQSGLADAGLADEDEVGAGGDEVEFG